ncbi:uncharacterized protein LOC144684767 [Cetorhinus maximus]
MAQFWDYFLDESQVLQALLQAKVEVGEILPKTFAVKAFCELKQVKTSPETKIKDQDKVPSQTEKEKTEMRLENVNSILMRKALEEEKAELNEKIHKLAKGLKLKQQTSVWLKLKKLLMLGATGQTGQFLVRQALEQGHVVRAAVRTPSKLTIQHESLTVVKANIFSANNLLGHFNEQDAIMSCLEFPIRLFSGVTSSAESIKAIVAAMRQAQVTRIITMSSWYTKPQTSHQDSWVLRWFFLLVIHKALINMHEIENYLSKECQDLNWTVVRPPGLLNAPKTDKELLIHEGYYVPDPDEIPVANSVAPGDAARFMLSLLKGDPWIKKAVAMATK